MNREELFAAIGQVEEERLTRMENMPLPPTGKFKEEISMKTRRNSLFRGMLIAAIVATMLATTAFAYTGFVVYDSPRAMLEAFFGEQPQVHGENCQCEKCRTAFPGFQREELDVDTAMEDVAPFISQVGDSVVDECMGNRLTVDAYTYDSNTGCGLVYYTLENEKGRALTYNLQPDGEIYDISPSSNHPCKEYLVQSGSTATRLKVACYFICDKSISEDFFRIGFNGLIRENSDEETTDYIYLPLTDNDMNCLKAADGKIILSSMGLTVGDLPCARVEGYHELKIDSLTIRYEDGTEYPVLRDTEENMTSNYGYALSGGEEYWMTYALNRVVDLEKVSAIVINGVEFPADFSEK